MAKRNFTEDGSRQEDKRYGLPSRDELYRWYPDLNDVMQSHVGRIRDFLDSAGLGWAHKNTDYAIDRCLAVAAHVRVDPAGRFEIEVHPRFLLVEDKGHIDWMMFHEHAHIIDWMGLLYSQMPEWKVRFNALGRPVPIGSVAKELFALHERDGIFKKLLNYPLTDERYLGVGASAQTLQSELFAQAVAANSFENTREVLQNEAPETAQFIADAIRHAAEHGEAPRFGANERSALKSLADSFVASRSGRGVSDSRTGEGDRTRSDEAAQEGLTGARSRNRQHPRHHGAQRGAPTCGVRAKTRGAKRPRSRTSERDRVPEQR
jgi:hypothetical protein